MKLKRMDRKLFFQKKYNYCVDQPLTVRQLAAQKSARMGPPKSPESNCVKWSQ